MYYLNNRIKKDIIKGGIIFAPSRSGKTVAIIDILCNSDEYILISCNPESAKAIISELFERGISLTDAREKVISPKSIIPKNKKIIIDEFMWNSAFYNSKIKYHAAVSRTFKTTIFYDKKGRRLKMEKEDVWGK